MASPIYILFFIIPLIFAVPLAYGVTTTSPTTVDVKADVDKPKKIKWIVMSPIDGVHIVTAKGNGMQFVTEGIKDGVQEITLTKGKNTINIWFTIPSDVAPGLYVLDLYMEQRDVPQTGGSVFLEAAKKIYHITPVFPDEPPVSSDDSTVSQAAADAAAQAAAEKAAAEKAAAEKAAAEKAAAEKAAAEKAAAEKAAAEKAAADAAAQAAADAAAQVEDQTITTPKNYTITVEDNISITDDVTLKLEPSETIQEEKLKPEIIAETPQEKTKVPSPLKQIKQGVAIHDVQCRDDRSLRIVADKPYCISTDTFEILKQRGWVFAS